MSIEIIQSIFLGIAQGLGEFLPISSTAHLIIIPQFLDFNDPGLAYDVALHLGTLVAVLTFFWRDWVDIFNLTFNKKKSSEKYNSKTLWFLVIATIPGVIAGLCLDDWAETVLRHPLVIASALFVFGLILYLVDKYFSAKKDLEKIGWKDSVIIGIAQAIAIIPGVSRSGATITAGRLLGLDRISAARFSFLLSTPIIFGAAILKINYFLKNITDLSLIVGIFVSAVSGFLAIKYLLKFVEKYSYAVFFWYRLILAGIILIVYFIR